MKTTAAPGAALRATALAAVAASVLAVVSGRLGGGAPHRLLAALALPPLVALGIAALIAHARLRAPAAAAFVAFVAAALATPRPAHVAFAALSLAATSVL